MPGESHGYNDTTHMGRETSKGVNEIIIRLLSDVASSYRNSSKPTELLECERSLHMLETMLGFSDREDYKKIIKLREQLEEYNPPTTELKREEFRENLVKRIDVVLFMMGRQGMLPTEAREEEVTRPGSW